MILFGEKERVGEWVGKRIGNLTPWHSYEAIGIESGGDIVGGVVIDNYIPNARCSIHCAGKGKKWLNREFLFVVFDYVFRQLKCNAVVNIVNSNNVASLKFTRHLGFKDVHVILGGGGNGGDGVILEMRKSDCKWIGK